MERSRSRDRDDRDDDRRSSRGRDRDDDRGSSRGRDRDDDRRSSRSRDDDDRGSRGRSRDRDDDRSSRGSGSSRSFQYQRRTADDLKKRAAQGANDFDKIVRDDVKMYKVADGENRIRILPGTWKDAKHYGYDIFVHFGVGPDRGSYLDLAKMKDEPDPITEERERERNERHPDEKYVKELDSKKRVGVWLIDRNNEREGVQFWAMPWTLDRDIVKVSVDRDSGEVLPVDDPQEGYDVIFDKSGQKDRTEYTGVSIARRPSPLGKDAWLDYAVDNPIPDILQFYSYEHIAKAFGAKGQQRDRSDDRDEDRRDRRNRDEDRDDDRGSDRRSSQRDGRSSRRSHEPDEPTWDSVHDMTFSEMEDLIEQEQLDIDPNDAKDDADLADWICDELKLEKQEASSGRRRAADEDDEPRSRGRDRDRDDDEPRSRRSKPEKEDAAEDKLASMRRRREADDEKDDDAPRSRRRRED